jgi:hypothetical protein
VLPTNHGLISNKGKRFFFFPKFPDWLWGQASLLVNENLGYFPSSKAAVA